MGGVPIGVAMPPMLAPTGMANTKAVRPRSPSGKTERTGASMASIMAAVAVLLINMEKMAVISSRPSITIWGLLPKGLSSTRAKLMSRRYLVAAMARKKPPMNSMMMGEAKVAMMLW